MKNLKKVFCLTMSIFTMVAFMNGVFVYSPADAQENNLVVYEAIEDTYVHANQPDANYGSDNPLKAKYHENDTTSVYRAAYVKFAVPEITSNHVVNLRLYAKINDSNAAADASQACYISTAGSAWNASTMTYATRTEPNSIIGEFTISGTSYRSYTIDVTDTIRGASMRGDEEITFVYHGGTKYITALYSCEATNVEKRPSLLVQDTMNVYEATEDTYVYANQPTTNFATANPLQAMYRNDNTDPAYCVAYIKFPIAEVASGKSIKLKLHAKIADSNATEETMQSCYIATAHSNWNAQTMTYENRATVGETVGAFVVRGTSYQAYTVDVTDVVYEAVAQSKETITFVYLGGTTYITDLYSCEASVADTRPSLVVEELVLQAERSTERYEPLADTYVEEYTPTQAYGSSNVLKVKEASGLQRISYLKFQVPQLREFDEVVLRLTMKVSQSNAPDDASSVCSLSTVDSNWDEATMTYENCLMPSEAIATTVVSRKEDKVYSFDVTQTVREYARRGEKEITFAFSGGQYIVSMYSKEYDIEGSEHRPYLVVKKGITFLNQSGEPLEGFKANSLVSCSLNETIDGGKIILASYEKKKLISADIDDAVAGRKLTVQTGDSIENQSLRVYVWNEKLSPLAPAVEFYNPFWVTSSLLTSLGMPGESSLVKEEANGALTYIPYTEKGDVLPDFSGVGYMKGLKEFPTSSKVVEVQPVSGDDTANIQSAVATVASYTPDSNGIRGVVLLKDGDYQVSGTIYISTSGVILRGESREGVVIHATGDSTQDNVVSVGGAAAVTEAASGIAIAMDYVPVGTKVLPLETTEGLAVGDEIVIVRPPSEQWIKDIAMDADGIFASSTNPDVVPWKAEKYEFHFERKIVAIDGGSITIDHPVVMSMEDFYGGGEVRKVLKNQRISQVGIESITFESDYDATVLDGTTCVDENHANRAVQFSNAQHCWAQNISARYFINECVEIASSAKYVTVTDCSATDFVSLIEGSRRYAFEINGQMSLVKNCVADHARHAFVQGARVCGPNVFYNCASTNDHSTSEPHHRWAMGCLYDNVSVTQGLQAVQRGDYGTGHGWAGANMVFWNCAGPHIGVMKPPTAQNFAIGVSGVPAVGCESIAQRWIRSMNVKAKKIFTYNGYPFAGDGYMELANRPAAIESLYLAQQMNFMNQ